MKRAQMIRKIMKTAKEDSGISTTDPAYLGARREVEAMSDNELSAVIEGIRTGLIYEIAAEHAQ